jgi:predicted N-acetyltransferase YhbS
VITGRELSREEIERVWEIDRREIIENIYYPENGGLVLKPKYYNMAGWPPGEAYIYTPLLVDCFERGGWFHGLFDNGRLIGIVILDNKFIGSRKDLLQLKFLHVSSEYRKQGLGDKLYELAKTRARTLGAKGLYISATPSENTVNFYLRRKCVLSKEPDPELFALEPEDIHLECVI